ncbi:MULTISPECIES: phage GP46 family protein [unclassified Acinetobacter]|uniref:phage GP46 family protein n=1 Tax=unclassified Acinetobacter TaxID=196816 RepID=UPI00190AE220|nr:MULTISPECIES: phage GP46 family protein [unclassified Acinetobacter]MBK0063976.1 phage GP46 family protein [Acinetobacter sp. S55]MBK0067261.1 phage GP46 family protein [Acinetobacter sp. S54]
MANINLETKDYVLISLDAAFINDDVQCVCQRLNIHRGKYWADPKVGSRFYLLKRSKDLARNVLLAKQYAEEALLDLVPSRFQTIVVNATQSVKSRVDLAIAVTRLTGETQTIQYFVPVGG